jgi:ribosomal protein S18 acetylase RimI-like enzyme
VLTGNSATPLVAEDGGRIIGAAVASFDGWRAYIYHVAVAPEARRQGIARELMDASEERLRQRGARRVYALVNGDNTAGLALAAVSGYMPEGDVVMEKELLSESGTQTEAALARA